MRILIEPGSYMCLNLGDMGMLEIAIGRLRSLWPDATIQVITESPTQLISLCPDIVPVFALARHAFFSEGYLLGRYKEKLPKPLSGYSAKFEINLRRRLPELADGLIRFKAYLRQRAQSEIGNFVSAISRADLLFVSGAGGMNDPFLEHSITILDTLDLARRFNIPTVMMGQGFGPINSSALRDRARAVLPHVSFIAVREGRKAVPLLSSLGVSSSRVMVTGDDAIELAYNVRQSEMGEGIGINLRLAEYSGVDDSILGQIRSILNTFVLRYKTRLIPIPISRYENESDLTTLRQLLSCGDGLCNGEASIDTPLKAIDQVSRCRIVITGSYHAGVFALAQGIPVVALSNSEYYDDKFLGLAGQFGRACEVISLSDPHFSDRLSLAIESAWDSAEAVRIPLLESAAEQINHGRNAYRYLEAIMSSRT